MYFQVFFQDLDRSHEYEITQFLPVPWIALLGGFKTELHLTILWYASNILSSGVWCMYDSALFPTGTWNYIFIWQNIIIITGVILCNHNEIMRIIKYYIMRCGNAIHTLLYDASLYRSGQIQLIHLEASWADLTI